MTRIVRKNSTEIFLVGPVVKTDGVANFGSALLTSASAAVAFLHDTATPVDISSYTWATASVGGAIVPGYYHLTLASAITSVPGPCTIVIQNSTDYLPIKQDYLVLGSTAFDTLYSSAPVVITAEALGILHNSAITSVESQIIFEMTDSLILDDNFNGQTCAIEDISTGDFHPTWITNVDQANNKITVAATAGFTAVAGDIVRIYADMHPQYVINTYDPPTNSELNTALDAGVNVTKFAGVTIIGSGSADSLFRTAGT